MKKKIFVFTAMAAMLLSACGAAENAPANTADMNINEDSSVPVEETAPEITEASQQNTDSSASDTEVSEAESSETTETEATEAETEPLEEIAPARYYELKITSENIVFSLEDFADKAAVETASELVKQTDTYKNNLAQAEECRDIVSEAGYEFSFEPVFVEGITDDMDGDGREESFFMLMPDFKLDEVLFWVNSYLFYSDADGNVTMLPGVFYSDNALLRPREPNSESIIFQEIMYNDFAHVLISTGFNNNTFSAYIYSAYENAPKLEACQKHITDSLDKTALLCSANQIGYSWLAVWDNLEKCYVTPECLILSDDELAEAVSDPVISQVLEDSFDTEPYTKAILIGGKYYSFCNDYMARTFIKNDTGFEAFDIRLADGADMGVPFEEFNPDEPGIIRLPYAEGFDLSEAASEMIPLER